MAIDQWLLEKHSSGLHPPTLRFYTWSPVAISLGYHQRRYPTRWHEIIWQGQPIDIVRRPTGGRAVLHQGDLTYMVVCSGFSGSLSQVYQQICEFLIIGWRSLGVELHYGQASRSYLEQPNCFATSTNADLVDQYNNKLIGSAQFRQGNAILQHGSILLNPDSDLFKQVFNTSPSLQLSFTTINSATILMITNVLLQAASQCFNIEFITQPLSEREWQEIKSLDQNL
ncbi:lipoate--protein ligase family protein [Chroococcus sp. FPU101]|uniref:lipoate--protein ligase family protein n=1 Tax=Chroococcus sp. FPU101 TaxID=1974212 RepID=UPI001A8E6488|nr:biotin/lipoate A/B protein ligase family protein [Chroococcus sp. FPU101]